VASSLECGDRLREVRPGLVGAHTECAHHRLLRLTSRRRSYCVVNDDSRCPWSQNQQRLVVEEFGGSGSGPAKSCTRTGRSSNDSSVAARASSGTWTRVTRIGAVRDRRVVRSRRVSLSSAR
jgi:hypothetical protein